jgi:hypothetical protein
VCLPRTHRANAQIPLLSGWRSGPVCSRIQVACCILMHPDPSLYCAATHVASITAAAFVLLWGHSENSWSSRIVHPASRHEQQQSQQ